MLALQGSRALLMRILAAIVALAVVLSLWMPNSLSADRVILRLNFNGLTSHPSSDMRLSRVFFPVSDSPGVDPRAHENSKALHALVHCMEQNDCHQNQTKVVLLASPYFQDYLKGSRGGESIWAHSTSLALTNMGYTIVYMPRPSLTPTIHYYQMFPDLVKLVVMSEEDASDCYKDRHNCRVSESNPTGIPPWKVFSFAFWTGPRNPLGLKWTLSPENYSTEGRPKSTYLGYSVEDSCRQYHFVPHHERENQAWILAKHLHYFTPEFGAAWSQANFDAVTVATGMTFAIGSIATDHAETKPELPSTHVNYGRINQSAFMQHLSRSRVLIGMSNPVVSPSPYDALCLGVPFINPITSWDDGNPTDMSRWQTQHNGLRDLGPPYVYNVFHGDTQGFVQAVKDALANPIDSYILPRMTMSAVEHRLGAILEADWQREAELLDNDK